VVCSAPFWDTGANTGGPLVCTRTKTDVTMTGTRELTLNVEPQPPIGATYALPPQLPQPSQFPQPWEHVQSRELEAEPSVGATYALPPNMQTTRPMMPPSDAIMTRSMMSHSDAIQANTQRTRNQAGRLVDTDYGQVMGWQAKNWSTKPSVNSISRSFDNVKTESVIVRSSGATFPAKFGRNMTVVEDTGSMSTQRNLMEASAHSNRMISAHAPGYGPLHLQRLNCNPYGGQKTMSSGCGWSGGQTSVVWSG